jgi:tetratricopeptide (TPR) repeat protein
MKLAAVMTAVFLAGSSRAQQPALPEPYAEGMRHLEQAARYSEQNSDQQAIRELEHAYRLLPPSAQLCDLVGQAYLKTNDSRSVELLRQAAELDSSDERWEKLYEALAANHRYADAVRLFAARARVQPQNARMHLLLGESYWNTAAYREGLQQFQLAAALDPDSARAHFRTGYARQLLGDLQGAKQSLARALQLDPELPLANLAMGHLLAAEGSWQEALPFLQEYARARPDDVDVRLTLGRICLDHQKLAEARSALEEAARLRTDDKRVHYLLGRLYSASGRQDLAAGEFERFSKLEAAEMERKRLIGNTPYYNKP